MEHQKSLRVKQLKPGDLRPEDLRPVSPKDLDRQTLEKFKAMFGADKPARRDRMKSRYAAEPFSELEDLEEKKRNDICEAYANAFKDLGIVDAINETNERATLVFSSTNTGSNEMRILEKLDPMLLNKNPSDVSAILTDFAMTPKISGLPEHAEGFKHLSVYAKQMDSASLDFLAGLHPLVLCERLGAIWHAAELDQEERLYEKISDGKKSERAPAISALLNAYRMLLGSSGYLIIDSNTTSKAARSTWKKMEEAVAPRPLISFLKQELGVSVLQLPSHNGVNLAALTFNTQEQR